MFLSRENLQRKKAELTHRSTWTSRSATNLQAGCASSCERTLCPWLQVWITKPTLERLLLFSFSIICFARVYVTIRKKISLATFSLRHASGHHSCFIYLFSCRKFPLFVHSWERLWIQGQLLSSNHSSVYVPRWRFYQPQWHWGEIHIWTQVWGWELRPKTHTIRWDESSVWQKCVCFWKNISVFIRNSLWELNI